MTFHLPQIFDHKISAFFSCSVQIEAFDTNTSWRDEIRIPFIANVHHETGFDFQNLTDHFVKLRCLLHFITVRYWRINILEVSLELLNHDLDNVSCGATNND
jgi:hypothetical protein